MEADARHKFNNDDLVIIMWSTKEREDRYSNGKWIHDTNLTQEKTYGKTWVTQFGTDFKSFLIRDLAYIKSIQNFLELRECGWEMFTLHPITNIDHDKVKEAGIDIDALPEEEKFDYWVRVFDDLCDGNRVDDLLEFKDVVEVYQDVFLKINKSVEGRSSYKYLQSRTAPNKDKHPMPLEALTFLDIVWPNNTLSSSSREYAEYWNKEIFKHKISKNPIHPVKKITRF
jgi:hypothetical protein